MAGAAASRYAGYATMRGEGDHCAFSKVDLHARPFDSGITACMNEFVFEDRSCAVVIGDRSQCFGCEGSAINLQRRIWSVGLKYHHTSVQIQGGGICA